jgi:hypothetical protein
MNRSSRSGFIRKLLKSRIAHCGPRSIAQSIKHADLEHKPITLEGFTNFEDSNAMFRTKSSYGIIETINGKDSPEKERFVARV